MKLSESVEIPDSYFIGTEVIYEFRLENGLDHVMNQKYRPLRRFVRNTHTLWKTHLQGDFPVEVVARVRNILARDWSRSADCTLVEPVGR